MKIVFFVHCFFPTHFYGTETYTLELARHYKKWGHDVTVVSATFQGEPEAEALLTEYQYDGIQVICIDKNRIRHTRVGETYYQLEMRDVFKTLLHRLSPDVVHVTHLINHTAVLLEVTTELGIFTFATFTDFFGFCLNNKLESVDGALCSGPSTSRLNCVACYVKDVAQNSSTYPMLRMVKKPRDAKVFAAVANVVRKFPSIKNGPLDNLYEDILSRPDILINLYNAAYKGAIAPTTFLRSAYADNGIKIPIHLLSFGVDVDRTAKPKRPVGRVPVVGFIGQIAPHKGTDLLVEAFARLPLGSARLRIYGPEDQDAAYMHALRSAAQGLDVEFCGTFDKESMADVLRDIDLLVIPSRWYENSPLVLLNSLATHTPVLVSDVLGMTEFLKPGVNGFSFKRGDSTDLANQLKNLVLFPEKLYALSTSTEYDRTPESMARETLALYSLN